MIDNAELTEKKKDRRNMTNGHVEHHFNVHATIDIDYGMIYKGAPSPDEKKMALMKKKLQEKFTEFMNDVLLPEMDLDNGDGFSIKCTVKSSN